MNFKAFKNPFESLNNWKYRRHLDRKISHKVQLMQKSFAEDCKKYGFDVADTVSSKDLMQQLKAIRGEKQICNIVGSGFSALKAQDEYSRNESYFTTNFGGLLEIPFDLYVFEIGTYESKKPFVFIISELQRRVLKERQAATNNLMVKNIWEGKLSKNYIEDHYDRYQILRDIYMPTCQKLENEGQLNLLFNKMFSDKQYFILQVHTSILTLVQLAVWSGYKKIKIYGLEGKGSHFFHFDHNFQNKQLVDEIRKHLPAVDDEHIHVPGFRARNLIHPMSKYLKKKYQINLTLVDEATSLKS